MPASFMNGYFGKSHASSRIKGLPNIIRNDTLPETIRMARQGLRASQHCAQPDILP